MSAWTSKKTKKIISASKGSWGYNNEHVNGIGGFVDSEYNETIDGTGDGEYNTTNKLSSVIQKHYGRKTLVRNRVPRKANYSFDRWELTYDEHIRNLRIIFERGLEELNLDVKKGVEFSKLFTIFIYECSSGEINI